MAGVCVAFWGVNKWRREQIGKRQSELAEEALAVAYEAQDVFDHVRNPISFGGEGSSRPKDDNESEAENQRRDIRFVPFERLDHHKDYFLRVQRLRPKFMAMFGKSAASPLAAVLEIRADIIMAVNLLADIEEDLSGGAPEDWEELREQRRQNQTIKWKRRENDPIDARIAKLSSELEARLEPILKSRYRS